MRLVFTKDSNNEIKAQIHTGTILTDFSYVEMVRQLIENKKIDDVSFEGIDDDEKIKIKEMLGDISKVFAEETDDNPDSNLGNEINEL